MTETPRYRTFVADSARWGGFDFRPNDIVISTPPKSGTTWTQMICALLLFDRTELHRPLAELSPWLDMLTRPLDDVVGALAGQDHRRFIKTHTPLDGLPFDDRVTYLCVGRDPRDVAFSWENHMANMNFDALIAARAAAVGLDDLDETGGPPAPPPGDPLERFWWWADSQERTEMSKLAGIFHHLETFWERRDQPRVALFHYADLLADLPGQMSRLAGVLEIDIPDSRIEELAAVATFDRMKEKATELVPNSDSRIWISDSAFFDRGQSGRWRHLLDEDGLRRYRQRVAELAAPDLSAWAHTGWLGSQESWPDPASAEP